VFQSKYWPDCSKNLAVPPNTCEPFILNLKSKRFAMLKTSSHWSLQYWRHPEKTAAAFLHVSRDGSANYRICDLARCGENGLMYFIGRNDTQIKSRLPHRVGCDRSGLERLARLRERAVVAIDRSGFEGWLICCAYVLQRGSLATPVSMRKELEKNVPGYMIPERWMTRTILPKTPTARSTGQSSRNFCFRQKTVLIHRMTQCAYRKTNRFA
jgi:acyl-coenzyme A synthetase/AMP-(fatty) acid ligase